MIKMFGKG